MHPAGLAPGLHHPHTLVRHILDTSTSPTIPVDSMLPAPRTSLLQMTYTPYTMRPLMTPRSGFLLVFPVLQSTLYCTED